MNNVNFKKEITLTIKVKDPTELRGLFIEIGEEIFEMEEVGFFDEMEDWIHRKPDWEMTVDCLEV